MSELNDRLFEEILQARQRVYAVGKPTPLQKLNLRGIDAPVYVKREDLGPIKAYKWRGAYNCMASLPADKLAKGVVAASAGNHAQGVALAARVLNCKARIYMPRSTPEVKQVEVKRHGGDHVEIVLHGDSYDETASAAHQTRGNGSSQTHQGFFLPGVVDYLSSPRWCRRVRCSASHASRFFQSLGRVLAMSGLSFPCRGWGVSSRILSLR